MILWYTDFLLRQIGLLNSLIEVESHSKWALVALVETTQRYISVCPQREQAGAESHHTRIKDILHLLCEIDSKHINRYRYLGANNIL